MILRTHHKGDSYTNNAVIPVQRSFWSSFFEAPLEMAVISQTYIFCVWDRNGDQVLLIIPEEDATAFPPLQKVLEIFDRSEPSSKFVQRFSRTKEVLSVIESLKKTRGVDLLTLEKWSGSYERKITIMVPSWDNESPVRTSKRVLAFDLYGIPEEEQKKILKSSIAHSIFYSQYIFKDQRLILMMEADLSRDLNLPLLQEQLFLEIDQGHVSIMPSGLNRQQVNVTVH